MLRANRDQGPAASTPYSRSGARAAGEGQLRLHVVPSPRILMLQREREREREREGEREREKEGEKSTGGQDRSGQSVTHLEEYARRVAMPPALE